MLFPSTIFKLQIKVTITNANTCTHLICHACDEAHIVITTVFEVVQIQLLQRGKNANYVTVQ